MLDQPAPMTYPKRLVGLPRARARFGTRAERLAVFFSESDPLADAAVLALKTLSGTQGQGRALLEQALEHGIASAPQAPAAVIALFEQLEHVPFWLDLARCDRGGQLFFRCGPLGGIALGFGSLARAYCSSGGNKPLAMTRALIDHAPKRVSNTGEFVRAVSTRDGMRVGAPGYRQTVHVRLMHARVRLGLLDQSAWRSDLWGVPINQADMAATALLFSHAFVECVRKLGVHVTEREHDDLLHLWRYTGYLLGVREELLCASQTEARELSALIDLIDDGPDEDSLRLLAPLIAREPFDIAFKSRRVGYVVHRLYIATCRELIGHDFADRVGLPHGGGDLVFKHLLRPTIATLGHALQLTPGSQHVTERAGQHYWGRLSSGARAEQSRAVTSESSLAKQALRHVHEV